MELYQMIQLGIGSIGILGLVWAIIKLSYKTGRIINILENHIKYSEEKFSKIDERLIELNRKIENKFFQMDERLDKIEDRLARVEESMKWMERFMTWKTGSER